MNHLKSLLFFLSLSLVSLSVSANDLLDPFTGTWSFTSPAAPAEYSKGEMIITKGGSAYYVEIQFENGTINATDVKTSGNTISFKVSVDGSEVPVVLKVMGDEIKGYSDTTDGQIEITGKRKI